MERLMELSLPYKRVMECIVPPDLTDTSKEEALGFAVANLCEPKTVLLDELAERFGVPEQDLTDFFRACTVKGLGACALLVIEDHVALVPTALYLSPELLRASVSG